jgi:hypothetical protein
MIDSGKFKPNKEGRSPGSGVNIEEKLENEGVVVLAI